MENKEKDEEDGSPKSIDYNMDWFSVSRTSVICLVPLGISDGFTTTKYYQRRHTLQVALAVNVVLSSLTYLVLGRYMLPCMNTAPDRRTYQQVASSPPLKISILIN